jgi:hypothetical protein
MSKHSITGSAQEMGLHVRGDAKPRDSARSIDTIGWCVTIIIGGAIKLHKGTFVQRRFVHLDA